MKTVSGRVAVVTGAASGIGLAVSRALASRGARVVMSDIDADLLESEVGVLRSGGHDIVPFAADVSDSVAVEQLAAFAEQECGQVNIAVNNAGIVGMGRSWEISIDEWRRILDVNLFGVVNGVRSFVPRILSTGSEGFVVNIGSRASVTAMAQLGPYVIAKHGVLALSDVLRAELEEIGAPVGVSVVMPGRIATRLNPKGHISPDQVANNVIDAILTNRPYVFTDHDGDSEVSRRLTAILDSRDDVIEC